MQKEWVKYLIERKINLNNFPKLSESLKEDLKEDFEKELKEKEFKKNVESFVTDWV